MACLTLQGSTELCARESRNHHQILHRTVYKSRPFTRVLNIFPEFSKTKSHVDGVTQLIKRRKVFGEGWPYRAPSCNFLFYNFDFEIKNHKDRLFLSALLSSRHDFITALRLCFLTNVKFPIIIWNYVGKAFDPRQRL